MIGAAITLSLLSIAGEPSEPIKLWHSYTRGERAALESVVDGFRASHPGFDVELSFVPFTALSDKLTAAIPRGHGPDLFIFAHDRVGGWAEGSLVEPIELFVTEEMLDRHETPCVFALAYGDSLYGLPLAFKSLALFVRTDQVEKPPETFDELLAIAKAKTDKEDGRYGFVYPNADLFFHSTLLFSLGGQLFSKEKPSQPQVNVKGTAASLALAHRLFAVEGILPDDPTPIVAGSMFSEGRTPLVINGPWFRGEIDKGVPYTVVPIPAWPGGKPSSGFSTCEGVLMSRYSKQKKRAFVLMDYLANDPDSALRRMIEGAQTVTLREAWPKALAKMNEEERAIFEAFKKAFATSVPTPSHPNMNAVWTPMNAALYKTLHKDMDPKAALDEAQARIERALRSDS